MHFDSHDVAENDRYGSGSAYQEGHMDGGMVRNECARRHAQIKECRTAQDTQKRGEHNAARITLARLNAPDFGRGELFVVQQHPMRSQSLNVVANPDSTIARRNRVQFMGHLGAANCSAMPYGAATKVMQTGAGASATSPVGVSAPVVASMRKVTMLLDAWLAARRNLPVGSMAKLRGVFPIVGYSFLRFRVPFSGSREKALMVSMPPRLDA